MQALNSDMAFSMVLNLSEPQFTPLKNRVILKINELIPIKYLEQCLAHCRYSQLV